MRLKDILIVNCIWAEAKDRHAESTVKLYYAANSTDLNWNEFFDPIKNK